MMQKNKNNKTNADKLREEFYKGMAELREGIKRLREAQEKTDAQIDKLRESQKETEKLIETLTTKTDAQIAKTDAEIDRLLKAQEKTDAQIAETDRLVKELSTNVGGINRSLGKISEDMSIPQIERMFDEFKINIKEYHPDVRVRYDDGAKEKEVDLILVGTFNNKNIAVVVETKARYKKPKEIDDFNKFVSEEFKQIFKTYKNFGVIGCVCALGYGTGLEKYAEKLGLFVMKPTKGIMSIVNKPDFKVKIV